MEPFQKEIWEDNYKGPDDETVEDTWRRVASSVASIEHDENREYAESSFYDILEDFKFVPGGRILANVGISSRKGTTLLNCFTHNPVDLKDAEESTIKDPDSISGILSLVKAQALTLKSEGGYGTNFSYLRPAGTYIKGIGGRTPGVLKFMELWDKSSEIITSGSDRIVGGRKKDEKVKIRKGAMMGILSVWHPEIKDFIEAKLVPKRLSRFNLSVGITKGFMDAVKSDSDWELKFPDVEFDGYDKEWDGNIDEWISKGYPIVVYETIKARDLWNKIMKATYTRNEPGVMFLDIANDINPLYYCETILQSNPCGEILMGTGVCNLGSLNLVKFVKYNGDGTYGFDYDKFKETIKIAVRFLDNINDISPVPLPEYGKSMKEKRRIGLGVMGLGSLHLMLGIPFGSDASLEMINNIWTAKAEQELLSSAELGKEKGSFPLFDRDKYFSSKWWNTVPISCDIKKQIEEIGEMRNGTHSMNAPTGNTGIFGGIVSGGIEPVFMKEYYRWVIVNGDEKAELKKQGLDIPDTSKGEWYETDIFKETLKGDEPILKGSFNGVDYEIDKSRGLIKAILTKDYGWSFVESNYPPKDIERLEKEGVFLTTENLTVKNHLDTLKEISALINMNSSKTLNLPNDISYDEFKDVYLDAYNSGIKGVTTYRAGTMAAVLEKAEEKRDIIDERTTELEDQFKMANGDIIIDDLKLPEEYEAIGRVVRSEGKKWYFHIAFADRQKTKPFAMFIHTNAREHVKSLEEFIETIEVYAKSSGINPELVKSQIERYSHQSIVQRTARAISFLLRHNVKPWKILGLIGEPTVGTLLFSIKKVLLSYCPDMVLDDELCPSCNGELVMQEGCVICPNCGYSKC